MADDLYIGLISGTSLDGIDAVLVRFNKHQPEVLASHCQPVSDSLKNAIRALIHPGEDELNRMSSLDVQLGNLFADCVNELLKQSKHKANTITAIGSHGQTIRHLPKAENPATLQIADPNIIAEKTGITTVADFRRRDMAAGGEGAPLVPAFHEQFFRSDKNNRVIINLGGIANITVIPSDKNKPVTGFDTGTANTFMNYWMQQHKNKSYDENGNWAKTGKVNQDFLKQLMSDGYFKLAPPKSTGTEYFSPSWLSAHLKDFPFLSAEDVQATLCEFTANTVADEIKIHAKECDEIFVCGGGAHNEFLLKRLQSYLPDKPIKSSAEAGIDPDYVEAITFAWLAKQTLEHKPGNLPDVTGASHPVILGGVYFGNK